MDIHRSNFLIIYISDIVNIFLMYMSQEEKAKASNDI